MTQLDTPLPADVLSAIQRGKVIEAIKLLREAKGLGWKEARDIVNRRLHSAAAQATPGASTGRLSTVLAAALRADDPAAALRSIRGQIASGSTSAEAVDKPATAGAPDLPNGLAPGEMPRSSNRLWLIALVGALALLLHLAFGRVG